MNLIFDRDTKTILLPVEGEDIDLDIVKNSAVRSDLLAKREFHISIIVRETGALLSDADYDVAKILATKMDWSFVLEKEFYLIHKKYPEQEMRKSIIQLVSLPGLFDFYTQLNGLIEKHFAVPFSHVTLYTNSTKKENELRGIGIYSRSNFDNLLPEKIGN